MEAKRIFLDALNQLDGDLEKALDGLSYAEISWRPANHANSIGFTLWHMTRAEDNWVNRYIQGIPQVVERTGLNTKWSVPVDETGFGYDENKLDSFVTPPLNELWEYHQAVRQYSVRLLEQLNAEEMDKPLVVEHPRRKTISIGRTFSHLLCEIGEHVGHICYIRGLQLGLNR